jgi:hypothetical protein
LFSDPPTQFEKIHPVIIRVVFAREEFDAMAPPTIEEVQLIKLLPLDYEISKEYKK